MPASLNPLLGLLGRILLALMFVLAGPGKISGAEGTAAYMASAGLPASAALAMLVGVFELVAGLALVVGFKARWAALALALFTLAASFMFHGFWAKPPEQQMMQQLMFLKNLAAAGGLFLLAAYGPGAWSLDKR